MITIKKEALSENLKKQIYKGFEDHAIEITGFSKKLDPVAIIALDGSAFLGAIVIENFWNALHIKYVYIDKAHRNQGLGTRLMKEAFNYGLTQGCSFAFVETMSFQALDFYRKMGFDIDFTRSGYAHHASFHYLSKKLPVPV
jgi:ribosomal protein S18 acetylase RimI-like enzyme